MNSHWEEAQSDEEEGQMADVLTTWHTGRVKSVTWTQADEKIQQELDYIIIRLKTFFIKMSVFCYLGSHRKPDHSIVDVGGSCILCLNGQGNICS